MASAAEDELKCPLCRKKLILKKKDEDNRKVISKGILLDHVLDYLNNKKSNDTPINTTKNTNKTFNILPMNGEVFVYLNKNKELMSFTKEIPINLHILDYCYIYLL